MKIIEVESKTHGKLQILLDDEDYEVYSKFTWTINKKYSTFYAQREIIGRKVVLLHREICKLTFGDGFVVDHINHNGLDNQKSNLRICTHSENMRNSVKGEYGASSKFKGVHFVKDREKWCAKISINKKDINLGNFINEMDAAKAYNNASIKYFGEFAKLNIIEE